MIGQTFARSVRRLFVFCLLFVFAFVVKTGSALAAKAARAQGSCISISSPAPNSSITPADSVSLRTTDTCAGKWYECFSIDGVHVDCEAVDSLTWDTGGYPLGAHTITVYSYNERNAKLASYSETVSLVSALAVLSPVSGATVSGTITIHTQVSSAVSWAKNYPDGADGNVCSPTGGNCDISFDTTTVSNGAHNLIIKAFDVNNAVLATVTVPVTVSNSAPTPTPSPTTTPVYFPTLSSAAPLPTDAQCAAQLPTTAETVSGNTPFNQTLPTAAQLAAYVANNYTFDYRDDYTQYQRVDGNYTGSTDMILRWAACKYGVDENVVRAQAWIESGWQQGGAGDYRTTQSACVQGNFTALWNTTITEPGGSTVSCPNCCYQSWSLLQTKVFYEWMTWPEIMQSTAFAADYRFADQRACMDGAYTTYMSGRGVTYAADVAAYESNPAGVSANKTMANPDGSQMSNQDRVLWGCIGLHYSGGWYDSGAQTYIGEAESAYTTKPW